MKNVLVIVYYFPPMGGSGVQRPLKFVKYLRDFGWNPIILRPEPGMYKVFDESLQNELDQISPEEHRVKGNTPFHVLGGEQRTAEAIPELVSDFARKIMKLLMYPDNKKGWIEPGYEKGVEIIQQKKIDLIFSTAPPFSNHILGSKLKAKTGLPLILDYRDSWTQNQFFTDLYGWQKRIMKKQENKCVQSADAIIGLDEVTLKAISNAYNINSKKIAIVEHGFDPMDFELDVSPKLKYKPGVLNLLYSGTFVEHNQPNTFFKGVSTGIREGKFSVQDLHLHFQGGLNPTIRNLISDLNLQDIVTEYAFLDHKQAVANLKAADALWVLENYDPDLAQIKNGKLFEYFGAQKPILGVVNPGKTAELVEQYGSGFVANVRDKNDIAEKIGQMILIWKNDDIESINKEFVEKFDRRKLTMKLGQIFDKISSQ